MRDSITGAWLYSIVLVFMVFMIGFVAISINYNKMYKVKTNILNMIEEYQGVNSTSINAIEEYLASTSTGKKKRCDSVKSIKGTRSDHSDGKNFVGINEDEYAYGEITSSYTTNPFRVCITKTHVAKSGNQKYDDNYYTVYMFFNITLPVFGDIYNMPVVGETNTIYYPVDMYSNL